MRRIPARFAVAVLLGGSLLAIFGRGPTRAAADEVPSTRWTAYRSNILHATITVPAAWVPRKTNTALAFHSPGGMDIRAGVGLMRSSLANLSIERSADATIAKEGPEGWTKGYATVGGLRAMKVIGSPKKDPDMKIVQYYIDAPSGTFLLQCMAPTKAWSLYAPLFSRIVGSVKFF